VKGRFGVALAPLSQVIRQQKAGKTKEMKAFLYIINEYV
jgi:hypothetical protein